MPYFHYEYEESHWGNILLRIMNNSLTHNNTAAIKATRRHTMQQCWVCWLYWLQASLGMPEYAPPKKSPFCGATLTLHPMCGSLDTLESTAQTASGIDSIIFAWLTNVSHSHTETDRHTDHRTSAISIGLMLQCSLKIQLHVCYCTVWFQKLSVTTNPYIIFGWYLFLKKHFTECFIHIRNTFCTQPNTTETNAFSVHLCSSNKS